MSDRTSVEMPPEYKTQELKDRYILIQVLDKFLKENTGEFGSRWKRQVSSSGLPTQNPWTDVWTEP